MEPGPSSNRTRLILPAVLLVGGALAWAPWSAEPGSGSAPVEVETGGNEAASESSTDTAQPAQPAEADGERKGEGEGGTFSLTEAESLQGSIKSVFCFPEGAGVDVLSTADLTPPSAGIQAMEGCLDLVGARHPSQAAIQLTTVFYLAPDGTVTQTGVGADVATPEAYDLLEPCARDYWLANAPRVRPSDEKSFSCVYSWSKWSLTGGVHRVGAHIPSVLSGRGTHAFGSSVTGP
ncbi:MAG: hypothetical protein ACPGU1_07590 [Myxococcota bacterium]